MTTEPTSEPTETRTSPQDAEAGAFGNPGPARRLVAVDGDAGPRFRPVLWSAARLMDTYFPPPKWAVPGVLCEGLTLLAGAPKVGKSWLSFDLAIAVATGGQAFGAIPVRPGPVLYLALEDTPRRLKARMSQLLGEATPPSRLFIATEWPTLPAGGDIAIAAWLDDNPDARLVVIDVFAKVRGPVPVGMSAYDADYAAVGRAKAIADHYGIAIVLIHHVRKAGSEDFLQEVSGTNGIAGAADATLVLKRARGTGDGILHVTGRDVHEAELPLTFEAETGRWLKMNGPAAAAEMGATRAAILTHVSESRTPLGPKAISEGTGIGYDLVKRTCARMAEAGQLHPSIGGKYTAPMPGSAPIPGTEPAGE
ncbi:AAA family ATPase [Spongisporangium articulatum]|uniref:AAA family ATPase n=1 Tax=Spongisporangium articulatum TaxID=3362603 RepID=A0ABW8AJS1_9ACTN